MGSFKQLPLFQFPTQQVIDNHITVQESAETTGYNVQYLQQLLRTDKLEAIKIGQILLINLASMQAYFSCAISSNDMRCGPIGHWQPPF